jgi:hypothetical protein
MAKATEQAGPLDPHPMSPGQQATPGGDVKEHCGSHGNPSSPEERKVMSGCLAVWRLVVFKELVSLFSTEKKIVLIIPYWQNWKEKEKKPTGFTT